MTPRPRIVLAGGTGFIGSSLAPALVAAGYDVTILSRSARARDAQPNVEYATWDPDRALGGGPWVETLDGAAAIVNLVGRTVDCRKTPANRKEILESRIHSVRALGHARASCRNPPPVWVQSATAHIYGDPPGDTRVTDESPLGTGFAPDVGRAWEAALDEATAPPAPPCRTVKLRISFVLGREGGPLRTLARLARFFLGGAAGGGRQWISWIHEADLAAIVIRALTDPAMRGTYLTTAPNPVTNADFMRVLRGAVRRPWSPTVPAPVVRLGAWVLRTDPELALLGRRCVPTRLLAEGTPFQFPDLQPALESLAP